MSLLGFSDDHDRKWIISTGTFDAEIRDYNWELTGWDERLSNLDSDTFNYGASAWYITGKYIQEKGWTIKEVER